MGSITTIDTVFRKEEFAPIHMAVCTYYEERDTSSITIRNSNAKFVHTGVSIGWAKSEKLVENTTVLGVETDYWVGSNATVVKSRGDASVGPLLSVDAYRDHVQIELTLLDYEVLQILDNTRMNSLTPQQLRVLAMLREGLLNKQIAYELRVGNSTIKKHVSEILRKLKVNSRTQAVIEVSKMDQGLFTADAEEFSPRV